MKNVIRSACAVLVLCVSLWASPVDLMIGARAYGFGGAHVAIASDPSAAYWNPACLSRVKTLQLEESNWIFQDVEGLNVNYVAAAIPIKFVGTIGGSWLLQYAKLEEGWDGSGPASTHSSFENQFSIAAGRKLWDELLIFQNTAVGLSANRHTYVIKDSDLNGAGWSFDVALYTGFPAGISLGFNARTLGTDMMGEKIDPELRFGLGWSKTFNDMHRVTLAADGEVKMNRDYKSSSDLEPAETNLKGFGGLEYAVLFNDFEIAVRGGGNGTLHSTLHSYPIAAGLGFKFLGYRLDYAFIGSTDRGMSLGYQHRISLVIDFSNLGFASVKTGAEDEGMPEVDLDSDYEMPEAEAPEESTEESGEETPEVDLNSEEYDF